MTKTNRTILLWGACLAILVATGSAGAAFWQRYVEDDCIDLANDPAQWAYLLSRWEQGAVILVQRHTTKCEVHGPDCPDGNEPLTELGRMEAMVLGAGVRSMDAPFAVSHSYLSRTHDTAHIAFEDSTRNTELEKPCKESFNDYVKNLVRAKNQVLVTHSSCINALRNAKNRRLLGFSAGRPWNYGISAFVEHTPDGHNQAIGCMRPRDWVMLVADLPSATRDAIRTGNPEPPFFRF